ncbi:MAG TPA: ammonium transporter, partial [Polyangia bacterium]
MTTEELKIGADTGWTLLTGFLVFFMNAGFGLIETGLCRKKNATMILSKNFVVFAIATLGYYLLGF